MAESLSEILENFSNETNATSTENSTHNFPKDMLGFTAACAFIIALFGTFGKKHKRIVAVGNVLFLHGYAETQTAKIIRENWLKGNLLTIFALPLCKKLRTTATAFVINLAVVELMFCLFILPMSGAQYAYLQTHTESLLSHRDCLFFAVARYTFTQVELQTIVAIALTRAIAVGCPRFYQKIDNAKVTGVYIGGIWIYSFVIRIPTALGKFGSYQFNRKTMECDMARDPFSGFARLIMTIFEAIIPVAIIIILYIFIFIMVKKSSMRVAKGSHKFSKSSSTSTGPSSTSEDPSGDTDSRKPSIASYKSLKRMMSDSSLKTRFTRRSSSTCIPTSRRDIRVARTIFVIFVMVLVCSVPVVVIHIIDSQTNQPRRFLAVHILYWLQYCLNVIIYVLMNRQYREGYVELLAKILPSCERHKSFMFPWENPSVSSRPNPALNSSIKSRKGSCSLDPAAPAKEYKPVDIVPPPRQGRLSAIPEVNSSSFVSSDDVFKDDPFSVRNDVNDNDLPNSDDDPSSSSFKDHEELGTLSEKEKWITQNGETVSAPGEEEQKL